MNSNSLQIEIVGIFLGERKDWKALPVAQNTRESRLDLTRPRLQTSFDAVAELVSTRVEG